MGLQPIIMSDQEAKKPVEPEPPGEAPSKPCVIEIVKWDEVFIIDPHGSYTVLSAWQISKYICKLKRNMIKLCR